MLILDHLGRHEAKAPKGRPTCVCWGGKAASPDGRKAPEEEVELNTGCAVAGEKTPSRLILPVYWEERL